jgi:hypothetical protein
MEPAALFYSLYLRFDNEVLQTYPERDLQGVIYSSSGLMHHPARGRLRNPKHNSSGLRTVSRCSTTLYFVSHA